MRQYQTTITDLDADVFIEWLAGFFEGEGSIAASIRNKNYSCGVPATRIQVQVATTNSEEPQRFYDYFKVGRLRQKEYSRPTFNTQYEWNVAGQEIKFVLEQLLPHLHEPKRTQAEYALEFSKMYKNGNKHGGGSVPKPVAQKRVDLCQQIRKLTQ